MIKFDEKCLVRTTYDLGRRISLADVSRELWNIVCTTKDGKGSLMVRDPRLPVAVVHPKGSISISGNYSLHYACKSLKIIASTLLQVNKVLLDTDGDTKICLFRVNYIIGRFRIKMEDGDAVNPPSLAETRGANYETIEKWMGANRDDHVSENGWNINMMDILLSKKYDWCIQHGIQSVFSTKKSSKRYELEMEMCKDSSPGAGTFNFRMNEHGEFRYTILLKEGEFRVSTENIVEDREALEVEKIQKDIDAAITHLNAFIGSFYDDIMVPCKKRRLFRSGF